MKANQFEITLTRIAAMAVKCNIYIIRLNNPETLGRIKYPFLLVAILYHDDEENFG